MEIISLSHLPYKEKDGLLTAISNEANYLFLVKGLLSSKSSNIVLSNPLIVFDVELEEGKYKYPIIKKSKVLLSPYHISDNLDKLGLINFIIEVTMKMFSESERHLIYDDLKNLIIDLKDNKTNIHSLALIYLAKALKLTGYSFEVNKCVRSGSKKAIAAFSFIEGGFIAKDQLSEDIPLTYRANELLVIREIFLSRTFHDVNNLSDEFYTKFVRDVKAFIMDNVGVNIKSFELIS